MTALHLADHVRSVAAPGGGQVLLDEHHGRCFAVNDAAVHVLRALDSGTPPADLGSEGRALVADLVARGLLVATASVSPGRAPEPLGTTAPRGVAAPGASGSVVSRLVAPLAMVIALLLLRLPFRYLVRLLSWSRDHWCVRQAGREQAVAAVVAAEAAGRHYPGRIACLEQAVGAVVALALRRTHLSLIVGVAHDPCRFHAWVATTEGPAYHPDDLDLDLAAFTPVTAL